MKLTVKRDEKHEGQASIQSDWGSLEGEWRDIYVDINGYFGPYKPELFAAAPDLLAALKSLVDDKSKEYIPTRLWDDARASIAKAEGRG